MDGALGAVRAVMPVRTSRILAVVWAIALFALYVFTRIADGVYATGAVKRGYAIGLIGLLAVGAALLISWKWFRTSGPKTGTPHAVVRMLLILGTFLWLVLMLFPLM